MEIKSTPINTQGLLHSRATVCVTGVGGRLLFDPPFFPATLSCISSSQSDVVHYSSSVNKHLDQVPGNRLPHNAWLFAARVALMPAVMNQPRLLQQFRGNQIYTRRSVTLRAGWLKSADKGVGHRVCFAFTSSGTFSAGHLGPFVVNNWPQSRWWLEMRPWHWVWHSFSLMFQSLELHGEMCHQLSPSFATLQ